MESGLLEETPEDFPQRVMRRIESLPLHDRRSRSWEILQWFALIGGGILGIRTTRGIHIWHLGSRERRITLEIKP